MFHIHFNWALQQLEKSKCRVKKALTKAIERKYAHDAPNQWYGHLRKSIYLIYIIRNNTEAYVISFNIKCAITSIKVKYFHVSWKKIKEKKKTLFTVNPIARFINSCTFIPNDVISLTIIIWLPSFRHIRWFTPILWKYFHFDCNLKIVKSKKKYWAVNHISLQHDPACHFQFNFGW